MPRKKGASNLAEAQQRAIVAGHRQGRTHKQLSILFNVSRRTIGCLLKRWRDQGGYVHKKSPGRPRITTSVMDRNIIRTSRTNPRLTATDIAKEIATPGVPNPSVRTIRRRLVKAGLNARRPVKKPMISAKNRKLRVKWAKSHLSWSRNDWKNVLWSDESKFTLFGSDGIKWIRRPEGTRFDPKYQLPTMKHGGGSCMVWGCFSLRGMGPLHRICGIMDRFVYMDILTNVMLPYARQKLGRAFIYQEDNDPKHRSKVVKEWFDRHRVTRMDWPSQSPDLNIIEPMWDELERRVAGKKARNVAEKFLQLKEAWEQIPQSTIDGLVDSMPRRCQAVIDSKGFATKY